MHLNLYVCVYMCVLHVVVNIIFVNVIDVVIADAVAAILSWLNNHSLVQFSCVLFRFVKNVLCLRNTNIQHTHTYTYTNIHKK